MAYPFFYFLRQLLPDAHIASVCVPWVADLQYRALVDEVVVLPHSDGAGIWKRIQVVHQGAKKLLADGPWDLAISLPNSLSSAWLLYRARATDRRGYGYEGRSWMLNQRVSWKEGRDVHRVQAYLNLLPQPGGPLVALNEFWKKEHQGGPQFDAQKQWPNSQAFLPPKSKYWVLAPGATASSRRWSVDSFSQLFDQIHSVTGWPALVVGGPGEASLAEVLLARHGEDKIVDFTASGSVIDLWKIFRNAQVTVTNESGLAHVASLCGSRVHIICGAADPKRTLPLGPGPVDVTVNPIDCWPCEKNFCRFEGDLKNACLKGIEPSMVMDEMNVNWSFMDSPVGDAPSESVQEGSEV